MTLNQSALLELTQMLRTADGGDLMRQMLGLMLQALVDAEATICNDNRVVLYVWYDNEFGYSCQVVRVMEDMAGVNPPAFPH